MGEDDTTLASERAAGPRAVSALARVAWFVATAAATTAALVLAGYLADSSFRTFRGASAFLFLAALGLIGATSAGLARFRFTRISCFVVMTGVGALAGWSIGSSDDAQAGLAALLVPIIGIPLAGAVLIGEGVAVRLAGRRSP